tara:strand:+ start:1131 stop:2174 length:1044 start_codon:yes stop_codon:yes gene_type:complete
MSQALQSLNAILKYKQERERQKIDKSLAMLDMGRRLQQEEREAAFQSQTMAIRDAQERRATAAEKASILEKEQNLRIRNKEERKLNIELDELNKAVASGQVDRKRELSTLILEEDLKQEKLQTEALISEKAEKAFDQYKSIVATDYYNNTENIIDSFQQQKIIPSVVFSKVETALANQEFELDNVRTSILNTVSGDEKKYLNKLIGKNTKYGDALLVGIYNSAYNASSTKGLRDNSFIMDALENMSISLAYDEDLLQLAANIGVNIESLKDNLKAVENIQREKNFIDEKIFTGEIQEAIDNITRNNVNKKINELAREVAERKGLDFMTYDERNQLIEEGFSEEEIDN